MTPSAWYAAVGLVALISTAMWAILARETGVYVSAGVSFTAWGWLAIVGGDVALANPGGAPIWIRQTTASVQFIALAMAVISIVVIAMRLMGAYPSPNNNAAEEESSNNQSSSSSKSA